MAPQSPARATPPLLYITKMDNTTNPNFHFEPKDKPKIFCSKIAMVFSLGPGKFYGRSLPRPRIYTDVKFNSDRVDPPVPVMDPLMAWAEDAHWSMGGLSFQRLRLQGRIEGNVEKLSKQREMQAKVRAVHTPKSTITATGRVRVIGKGVKKERVRSGSDSPLPPPAPKITKRRRFMDYFDEESQEEEEQSIEAEMEKRKKLARKLVTDFEKVANETPVAMRTRRRELEGSNNNGGVTVSVMKVVEELNKENSEEEKLKTTEKDKNGGESKSRSSPVNSVRTSPRLAKKA